MKDFVLLLLLVTSGALGYAWYSERTEVLELQDQIRELRKEKPQKVTGRVDCYLCEKEGVIMVRNNQGIDKQKTCPFCSNKGSVNIRLNQKGSTICPDCGGIGKRIYNAKEKELVALKKINSRFRFDPTSGMAVKMCQRCKGDGVVIKK